MRAILVRSVILTSEADMADEHCGGYRLLKHMVTGQTSQVWEVVELTSGRHFAMKLLLPEKVHDPSASQFHLPRGRRRQAISPTPTSSGSLTWTKSRRTRIS